MKRQYSELMNTNRDLINGYKIRSTNHDELLKNVKLLNQIVQRAANLRGIKQDLTQYILSIKNFYLICVFIFKVGRFKTDVVASSRTAIKQNNTASLMKIIKTGLP
jgi:Bardet-Biedl syndrome 2 protein